MNNSQPVDVAETKVRSPRNCLAFFIKGVPKLDALYHFKAIGLPDVYLLNGYELRDGINGGKELRIDNVRGLMHAVALAIIERKKFSGAEFKFLRKQMKLTQGELARRMGITDQTIANYEKGKTAPSAATAHLRLLFLLHVLPPETVTGHVNDVIASSTGADAINLPEISKRRLVDGWSGPVQRVAA